MIDRPVLMSVRPRFADAILSGAKTTEVRRRSMAITPGTRVILYASSPTRAVVGTARIASTEIWEPEVAWGRHRGSMDLARAEFDRYLTGTNSAYLLLLTDVETLEEPISLGRLREHGPFQPPQSLRYVASSDPTMLRRLAMDDR